MCSAETETYMISGSKLHMYIHHIPTTHTARFNGGVTIHTVYKPNSHSHNVLHNIWCSGRCPDDCSVYHSNNVCHGCCVTCFMHILLASELGGAFLCPSSLSAGQLSKTDISFLLSHGLKLTQSP